jgi:hypothetical protein
MSNTELSGGEGGEGKEEGSVRENEMEGGRVEGRAKQESRVE